MDDLLKRLRFGSLTTMGSHRMNLEAADRIEELEAQLRAADALAEALRVIESHRRKCHEYDADVGDELRSFDEEDVILMEWQARTALAAYQATKEGE